MYSGWGTGYNPSNPTPIGWQMTEGWPVEVARYCKTSKSSEKWARRGPSSGQTVKTTKSIRANLKVSQLWLPSATFLCISSRPNKHTSNGIRSLADCRHLTYITPLLELQRGAEKDAHANLYTSLFLCQFRRYVSPTVLPPAQSICA